MNKPAIPSRSLLEGKPYTPADKTDLRATFARLMQEQDGPDYRQAEESEQAQYEEQQ